MKASRARRPVPALMALIALTTALTGVLLAGCASDALPPEKPPPATLQPIPGSPLHRVVLTAEGLASLQLETAPVRQVNGHDVVPMTAVVYDPHGAPWTYLVAGPRTYLRAAIVISGVAGGMATLASGPPAGTPIVTVGAPELLGAEYGVGEE